ncbi:MAG TPA: enoyl-CoA hydratase-related protein [Rhizomicrobium sp.]|jgi:enoyl-CoA hydratase/carnithine racemase|nr:enoyl-CoA hydratase-related protein [Rhizomicrobium sp.]
MTAATLLIEQPEPGIQVVRFNRPEAANALNTQMAREILAHFSPFLSGPSDIRCIVLTGSGDRAFSAGGDFTERDGMSDADWLGQHQLFEQAFYALMNCPIPIIAAVSGAAYGGGCEFALACDFIYAVDTARFAQTETRLGIIPGGGGTQTLARVVGPARAKEIILSAAPFDAAQAERWGMVNKVVPREKLMDEVLATARLIAANGPVAVRQAKFAISNGLEVDRRSGLAMEIAAYNQTVPTKDRREGIRAAVEKRTPKFTGS